jgi:hypothetical protein
MTDAWERTAAGVRVLTEEELAGWLREKGRRVVFSRGRFWVNHWGFYRLLHFAATMPAGLVDRPGPTCWAAHALLPDDEAARANASSPLHLVRDLASFDEHSLGSTARKQLRRSRAGLRLVRVSDPDLLRGQGWPVFSQNARRLGLDTKVTQKQYLAGAESLVTDPRRLTLAAMDGDRLLAYLETYAVGGTAYLDEIRLSDESQSRQVSGFLHYEACQVYRRSGLVTQVCAGPPLPERLGVSEFKRRWGIPIVMMPAWFWSPAPFRELLKVARPGAYYRATGRPARGVPANDPPSPITSG